jgi:serine/threonine-protein kinase HipA
MKKIKVFYSGWGEHWPLGVLADNGRELLFEYDAEALKQNLELSPLKLKLRKPAFQNFPIHQMRLPGLISDCLPDGWGLLLMDKLFRRKGLSIAEISPLDRLAFLGDRAMGALSFEPHTEDKLEANQLSLVQIAEDIQETISGKGSEVLPQLALMGGSPQGARPKVLVNFDQKDDDIYFGDTSQGEPWLIKFQSQGEHKEVCALEDLYAEMARNSGLIVSETKYFDITKNLSAFGTKRFDRQNSLRIPIHSLAGVLDANFRIPSSVDYLSFLQVTRLMTNSEAEVSKAFRQCVFNVIFNNRDDHAKNFSFILGENRRWKLAPAYDLTFCVGPGGEHQMDIMGEGKRPGSAHLIELGTKAGLDKKTCLTIIDEIIGCALLFRLKAKERPIRKKTIAEIDKIILENINRARV